VITSANFLMNYKRTNLTEIFHKITKALLPFCALSLAMGVVLYSPKISSQTLPDCSTLTSNIKPGNNCLFNQKKLCSSIPYTDYVIDSNNIISSNPIHRSNCYDLIDLTLCDQIPQGEDVPDDIKVLPGQNCVNSCNSASFSGTVGQVRGRDYAVHNRDCIRFCDEVDAENTSFGSNIAKTSSQCTSRKCNQMSAASPTPNPTNNCDKIPCNLLSTYELIDVSGKISSTAGEDEDNPTNNFCDGEKDITGNIMKCYKFSKAQLPYTIRDRMCKTHNCTPTCSSYQSETDENGDGVIDEKDNNDVVNVSNQGEDYVDQYEIYINGGVEITSSSFCNRIICKPVVNRLYRCTTNGTTISGTTADTVPNNSCDTTGNGAICSGNYCYKTIDCNKAENSGEDECKNSGGDDDVIGSTEDTMDSWFYRPKPMDIATNGNGVILSPMSDSLCYSSSQLEEHRNRGENEYCPAVNGNWGQNMDFKIPLPWGGHITIPLGYFHSSLCEDQTRSPGLCGDKNVGFRGNGYIYLCYGDHNPNSGNLYSKVSQETAYYKGYVKSAFSEGNGIHKVVMCLRFRNALRPDDGFSETCGKRQCAITCAGFAGGCYMENCGYDVCKELTIDETKPDECAMNNSLFNGDLLDETKKPCLSVIDDYLRLRVQKYGNKICGFLDVKGHLAYETKFFTDGTEKTANGYCLDGSESDNCNAKNTNDIPGETTKWRTMKFDPHIPYIKNNQPSSSSVRGYLDRSGQLFPEQDCIKVSLRVPPGKLYNLANSSNMPKLSIPPLYVTNAMVRKGGNISIPVSGESLGNTDFHEPEIEVRFGNTLKKLSLSVGKTGYEEGAAADPLASATIETNVNSIDYSSEVFVRKEHDALKQQPIFCLLKKVQGIDGIYIEPQRIVCVNRNPPEISSLNQKILVSADSSNSFESARILLRYATFGSNGTYDNCASDDSCTSTIGITNTTPTTPDCSTLESYQVCAQRDECSKLNSECMSNEIAIQNAKNNGDPINSLLIIRNNCNDYLLPFCNAKKGIDVTTSADSVLTNTNSPAVGNAYGWFNEICLVGSSQTSAFDGSLKKIIAYKSQKGVMGKCLIDVIKSPYITDGDGSTNCDSGGKAPNCFCVEYVEGMTIDAEYEVRTQTRREAGLCVDFPIPETCPAIIYNSTNPDSSDPNYVNFSLNHLAYGTVNAQASDNVVHISHKYRSEGLGHAEFPTAVMGMNFVEGTCKGFWKNNSSDYGFSGYPLRNCKNIGGHAEWDNSVTNECVRYRCSEVSTSDPDISGNYSGGYGATETTANKGLSNGYATWPSYLKTNDFLETATANACITGFKKSGAVAVKTDNVITSYSGGILPQRSCNQRGEWGSSISNVCQRIYCSAVTPPINPVSSSDWAQWSDSGGATFPTIQASRSSSEILPESIQTGTCNESLGFYQLGGSPPSRKCDSLGNWLPVENRCSTRCEAITRESDAKSSNHGFAYWNEANPPVGTDYNATATSCVAGYVPYPYPPVKNSDGVKHTVAGSVYRGKTYKLSDTGVNYDTILPLTVAIDTRPVDALPHRFCKLVASDGVTSNYWYAAYSECINRCPGAAEDERIGVGVTKHNTNAGQISISWNSTPLNTWAYVNSNLGQTEVTPNLSGHDASLYSTINRTNGKFILARKCNANGKWSDPVPQCVTNGGVISGSNAVYDTSSSTHVDSKTIDVNGSTIASATSCITGGGYYQTGKDTGTLEPISTYSCEYSNSDNKIDQTYFKYISGSECRVYCYASTSTNFGTKDSNNIYKSTYTGSAKYVENGDYLNLTCNEGQNYGREKLTAQGSTDVTSCGRTSKWRSTNPPKALCNSDGSWGSVLNQCDACMSCIRSSSVVSIGSKVSHDNTEVESNSTNYTAYSSGQENCGNKTVSGSISSLINSSKCDNSPDFSKSHGGCVKMGIEDRWSCQKTCNDGVSKCDRHTDLSASLAIECADGAWIASTCSTSNYNRCY
jgi:hypothetical protein